MSTKTQNVRSDASAPAQSLPRGTTTLISALVAVVYVALAVVAYEPVWIHGWNDWALGAGQGDPAASMWSLSWMPYALSHGRSLLFSGRLNAPYGVNLTWQTGAEFVGLLVLPITQWVGPVAAYNVAMTLAPAAAAFSLYAVVVRLGMWRPAGIVAGYLYGFGPFMLGQGYGHLNLVTVFLFPLIFYRLHRAVVGPTRRPVRDGVILGALLCAQFFTSTEFLSDAAILSVIALVLYLITGRAHARNLLRALPTYLVAGGVVAVVLAYPVWFLLAGPQHLKGLFGLFIYSGNLLDVVVPTNNELLHATPWLAQANAATLGALDENGTYLGVPLVVLMVACIAWARSHRQAAMWAAMGVVAEVLSLGPVLIVGSQHTGIPLPMAAIERLPLVGSAIPVRYAVFADLFAALAVAAVLTGIWGARRRIHGLLRMLLVAIVAAAVLVPFLPGLWPYPVGPVAIPAYFSAGGPSGGSGHRTIVTYPFPAPFHDQPMLWQANARMAFRLVGAYELLPPPVGFSNWPQSPPSALEAALHAYYAGTALTPVDAATLRAERADLTRWGATTLVAAPLGVNPAGARALFSALAGRPPVFDRGVWVWRLRSASSRP